MLQKWLAFKLRQPCECKFPVYDIYEDFACDHEVIGFISNELLLAHGNPIMIKENCQKLLEDAKSLNMDVVGDFVEQNIILADWEQAKELIIRGYLEFDVLPKENGQQNIEDEEETKAPKGIARIGNFGEVLAARCLIDFEGFTLPIYKLRFREKRDWASRLTDLCLIKREDGKNPNICFGEVKTKTSGTDKRLALKGHESLGKDDALSAPEVLRFISQNLYSAQKYDDARLISDLRLKRINYTKRHDLFLVHDADTWSEEVINNLNKIELNENLVDFSVRVVLIKNLKDLIKQSYSGTWLVAKGLVDG